MTGRIISGCFVTQFDSAVAVYARLKSTSACYYEPLPSGGYVSEERKFGSMPEDSHAFVDWALRTKAKDVILGDSCGGWQSLMKTFSEAGLKVTVVDQYQGRHLRARQPGTSDALWLARLGYIGILRPITVADPRAESARREKARELAVARNCVAKWLVEHDIRLDLVVRNVFSKPSRAALEAMADGESPAAAARRSIPRLEVWPDHILKALAADLDGKGRAELRRLLDLVALQERGAAGPDA
ncbi:MAG: hypothetical protein LBT40_00590 [Deltaproteobacteria bacterium]|jgi:hypothetical protein|nr:hypothetical protein [Deltaproteobacteria bacterium]